MMVGLTMCYVVLRIRKGNNMKNSKMMGLMVPYILAALTMGDDTMKKAFKEPSARKCSTKDCETSFYPQRAGDHWCDECFEKHKSSTT